jgi:hypothetical protein
MIAVSLLNGHIVYEQGLFNPQYCMLFALGINIKEYITHPHTKSKKKKKKKL